MAKNSRVPAALGAIPVVGDLVKKADSQALWLQDVLEQNARLAAQLPATLKSLNDSLDQFNKAIGRLDRTVTRIEAVAGQIAGPLEAQVLLLTSTLERVLTLITELPGAGIVRRLASGRPDTPPTGGTDVRN